MSIYQRLTTIITVAFIVIALILYMCTFTVRFDQVAVRTTFGNAGENSVITEPGLKFRWPAPIQTVDTYSNRLYLLRDVMRELILADQSAVVVQTEATWRISNALDFYTNSKDVDTAEEQLRQIMAQVTSEVIQNYAMADFQNAETWEKMEAELMASFQSSVSNQYAEYGIEIEHVALIRLALPQATSEAILNAMKSVRQRLAEEYRSQGDSRASTLLAEADAVIARINQFSETYAERIVNEGIAAQQVYYAQLAEYAELAVFLENIEFLRQHLRGPNVTLFLKAEQIGLDAMLDAIQAIVPPSENESSNQTP